MFAASVISLRQLSADRYMFSNSAFQRLSGRLILRSSIVMVIPFTIGLLIRCLFRPMQRARSIDYKHFAVVTNALSIVIIDHRACAAFCTSLWRSWIQSFAHLFSFQDRSKSPLLFVRLDFTTPATNSVAMCCRRQHIFITLFTNHGAHDLLAAGGLCEHLEP